MQEIIDELVALAEEERKCYAESKNFVVNVDYLGEKIHRLAQRITGRETLPEKNELSVFFDERAIKMLKRVSVNYYWFWRVILHAARQAEQLPIKEDQLALAISDLRANVGEHVDLSTPFAEQDPVTLALSVAYGVAVLKPESGHRYLLERNPLFQTGERSTFELGLASMYE
ncbi:MAG TPA: hypothetical protein V6D17_01815 [Candidatus Obscuribacterales bacterium]